MGWLEETVADGQRFLIQREPPMSLIRTSANRYLVTEVEQRQWLQTLLDRVQAEFVARKVEPDVGEHGARRSRKTPAGRCAYVTMAAPDLSGLVWSPAPAACRPAPFVVRTSAQSAQVRVHPRSAWGVAWVDTLPTAADSDTDSGHSR